MDRDRSSDPALSIDPGTRSEDRFQVLAIDGGGIRGIFAAALLAGLEEDLERPLLDSFDLVVGTSTGGIIALGLGAGISPQGILNFYVAEKGRIFPDQLRLRWLRHLFLAKYSPTPLEAALRERFGEKLLGESAVPLVIPSYDLGENAVHPFKTPHHDRLRRDYKIPMWAVGMATAAAPTYLPTFRLPGDHARLIDGGVWANNPALVGVTEAVSDVREGPWSTPQHRDDRQRPDPAQSWPGQRRAVALGARPERRRCSAERAEHWRLQSDAASCRRRQRLTA